MDRYAVIGNPVAHSKSPQIHAQFARQTGEAITYQALLAPLDSFPDVVARFARSGGKGLNVTVPFKLDAFALADKLSAGAEAAGAVNTLSFDEAGVAGDNTDGVGLVRDITANLKFAIAGRRVLLIGAGGAARGVVLPLLNERPATLTIANRTVARATELARRFAAKGQIEAVDFGALAGRQFDLLINATSASLDDQSLPIAAALFAREALAYDMMYGTGATPFLAQAKAGGAITADGLGMLVEQAAESFFLWRGMRPDTEPVLRRLRQS